jgi:hypothetical protein
MAMFQQYQGGIAPVQGMAEAGANIGKFAQMGMQDFGKSLSEGINAYNENSAKSEMANVKIASLSQDIANKIAMYSQDPEIAQSGVLQGLMQKGQMLTEAPTKGLSQRLAIAHDAETSLAGFGQQLQEWSFLRGRAIERGIDEGLKKFENATTTTDPVFFESPEFDVNPNETIQQQKDRIMSYFKKVRSANPNIKGTDEDFWAGWVDKAQQQISKAQGIHPSIVSAQLEALQAEKNIAKNQKAVASLDDNAISGLVMNKDGFYEEQVPIVSSIKDYAAMTAVPADKPYNDVAEAMKMLGYDSTDKNKSETISERLKTYKKDISDLDEDISKVQSKIEKGDEASLRTTSRIANNLKRWGVGVTDWWSHINAKNLASYSDKEITPEDADRIITETATSWTGLVKAGLATVGSNLRVIPSVIPQLEGLKQVLLTKFPEISGRDLTTKETKVINDAIARFDATRKEAVETLSKDSPALLEALKSRKQLLQNEVLKTEKLATKEATAGTLQKQPAPKVSTGDLVVGQFENTRPLTVSERKSQVQDFLTQRFGAIDPTDPTGKKRIPVQGFDSFFQKAIPESELKEFTTEGGTRLIRMNGKWEMLKESSPKSLSDIRKDMIGVYGKQTADGRLVPTEFIPNSGIEIGGLYRGTDASEAQFNDEMVQLSDARRSIRKLQEINDSVGEFADLTKMGIAEVEVMNLKSALRKDIIGVGTVSNFEQSLIDKVIRNPTAFFSMEAKDRAILLALAQRIDRRIQNIGAAKGLTVRIRDVNSANRYEALRQQYLKAKGIL